jgi:hypothetical protein
VSTPAVPVYIPGTALTTPGYTAEAPAIALNIVGQAVTAPGTIVKLQQNTIIIPDTSFGIPAIPVGTPNQTIVVNINGIVESARYLVPNEL